MSTTETAEARKLSIHLESLLDRLAVVVDNELHGESFERLKVAEEYLQYALEVFRTFE